MKNDITKQMEMVLYRTEDDSVTVSALIKDESIWITQRAMAELFGVQTPAISKHLKNIFEQGELNEKWLLQKLQQPLNMVQFQGRHRVHKQSIITLMLSFLLVIV